MTAQVGQRVLLQTLMYTGSFPGTIVELRTRGLLHLEEGTVTVKLDRQDHLVTSVLYFDEEPKGEIHSSLWQICWPADV